MAEKKTQDHLWMERERQSNAIGIKTKTTGNLKKQMY